MWRKLLIFLCVLIVFTISCDKREVVILEWKAEKIALDSSTDKYADSSYLTHLQPYRDKMLNVMQQVIGVAPKTLKSYPPESPLSNLLADICLKTASNHLKQPVDLAILNFRGIRADLPAGDITVGTIFRILPFENELVILQLRGHYLQKLFEDLAPIGGGAVAGIRMKITNNKPTNITINQKPLDPLKIYTIATNDYLAEGNDGMAQLANYETIEKTGIKFRDMFINYIQQQTDSGKYIEAVTDRRITILN